MLLSLFPATRDRAPLLEPITTSTIGTLLLALALLDLQPEDIQTGRAGPQGGEAAAME